MPEIVGTLKPPRLSSAPGSPSLGQIYYDTVTNTLKYWNGTVWVTLVTLGTRVFQGTTQSIPTATWTAVIMDTQDGNDAGMWVVGSPTRLTIPSNGWYSLSAGIEFNASATGAARFAQLTKNGISAGTYKRLVSSTGLVHATFAARVMLATQAYLVAGDYIELYAYQDTGANLGTAVNPTDFRDTHIAAIKHHV